MIDVFASTLLNATNEQIRVLDKNMQESTRAITGNGVILRDQLAHTNDYLELIAAALTARF